MAFASHDTRGGALLYNSVELVPYKTLQCLTIVLSYNGTMCDISETKMSHTSVTIDNRDFVHNGGRV